VVGALAATVLAAVPAAHATLPLHPCSPQGVIARCGTLLVPENRARPGRTIGLNVVVVPAVRKQAARDAFTYLAGGPGGAAATEMPATAVGIWAGLHRTRDIVLVDQRGTGASNPLICPEPKGVLTTDAARRSYVRSCIKALGSDPRLYGTRAAVDDLEAVRKALGYRTFDVYGTSYGATVAQMYVKRYPLSVRTLALDGATFTDVPFYARFARAGRGALAVRARECSAQPACAKAFPRWRTKLETLVARWNETPRKLRGATITGDGLAGIVQRLLLTAGDAARIPLLVSTAAAGDLGPLRAEVGSSSGPPRSLMYWTIMCNEPWVGAEARGPWGTFLDGYLRATLAQLRTVCTFVPRRPEPVAAWSRVRARVPTLVLTGEADPQDPLGNLPRLRDALPRSLVVVARGQGHAVGQYGCLGTLTSRLVERGTTAGLDTRCARTLGPPVFALR